MSQRRLEPALKPGYEPVTVAPEVCFDCKSPASNLSRSRRTRQLQCRPCYNRQYRQRTRGEPNTSNRPPAVTNHQPLCDECGESGGRPWQFDEVLVTLCEQCGYTRWNKERTPRKDDEEPGDATPAVKPDECEVRPSACPVADPVNKAIFEATLRPDVHLWNLHTSAGSIQDLNIHEEVKKEKGSHDE